MIKKNHFGYKLFRCEMNKTIHKQLLKIFIYSAIILLTFFSFTIFCARDNFYSYFSRYEGVEFCYIYDCQDLQDKDLYLISENNTCSKIVKNGHYIFVYSPFISFRNVKFRQGKIVGDKKKYFEIIDNLNLKNIYTERVDNIIATYGYSCRFGDFRYVDNCKVNIQIVLSNGYIIFGSPMIYGSY